MPVEIRRSVLVEAGHRCAIPTCLYTTVDIHHIVPWEKCQSHDFANLIALCPNCHRRADAGEIDRKSLRLYKARLGALEHKLSHTKEEAPWRTESITEIREGSPGYEFEYEYPIFSNPEALEVTDIIRAKGLRALHAYRANFHSQEGMEGFEDRPDWFSSSFEIVRHDESIISIQYQNLWYGSGAAHPNSGSSVLNYLLSPVREIRLRDFFDPSVRYLEWLSERARSDLMNPNRSDFSKQWVEKGTEPSEENYASFAIGYNEITITFDTYQVDCYAAGPQVIIIPIDEVRPVASEHLRAVL